MSGWRARLTDWRTRSQRGAEHLLDVAPATEATRGKPLRWRLFTALVAMVLVIGGMVLENKVGILFAEDNAQAEDKAQNAIDKARHAVQANVALAGASGQWELERGLEPSDVEALTATHGDVDKVEAFFKARGGHVINGKGSPGWEVTITSDREEIVMLTKLRAEVIKCWNRVATVNAGLQVGGPEAWEDISFGFTGRAATKGTKVLPSDSKKAEKAALSGKLLTSSELRWNKVIYVGGGETPGALNVSVFADKDCEFVIKADYRGTKSGETGTLTIKDKGRPFVARASHGEEAKEGWFVDPNIGQTWPEEPYM
ncbi:hypothetical protein [Streptomyces beigongshangae]|uniref:hypothetical protein n=1 Tax=Streptomyces beigongshangae TaxID=2841597 RepID=UPI001C8570E5|nr:hypothetical protein [Streptomyces sp. REN17]